MVLEERIVNMLSNANLEVIKHWVSNDISMMQNLDSGDKMMVGMLSPLLKEVDISVDKVMFFLKEKRPDIYSVVTREWISKQVDELKGKV